MGCLLYMLTVLYLSLILLLRVYEPKTYLPRSGKAVRPSCAQALENRPDGAVFVSG